MSEAPVLGKLQIAAHAVLAWANASGVPIAIIGGIAVSILGKPRTTKDVDAVAWLPDHDAWPAFLSEAAHHGIIPRISDPLTFALHSRVLLLQHQESGVPIDLSLGALPFEENAIKRAVLTEVGGFRLPLPVVEDLLVMKAIAHRPRDLADMASILDAHATIDEEWVLQVVREFALLLESPEIVTDLETLLRNRHARVKSKKTRSRKR